MKAGSCSACFGLTGGGYNFDGVRPRGGISCFSPSMKETQRSKVTVTSSLN
jgi:hypothetical protein